jgi:nucleotide-binding universal stress UspA family protein
MTTILCATRGGEASIRTQERAISLAKERQADLVFFYVTDVSFLNLTGAPIVVDVATEIEHMGEFLLLMAKERAEKAGVKADTLVKRGVFREALIEAVREVDAALVVMGTPDEGSLTQRAMLENIAEAVKQQTGVDTVIAGD